MRETADRAAGNRRAPEAAQSMGTDGNQKLLQSMGTDGSQKRCSRWGQAGTRRSHRQLQQQVQIQRWQLQDGPDPLRLQASPGLYCAQGNQTGSETGDQAEKRSGQENQSTDEQDQNQESRRRYGERGVKTNILAVS